MTRVSRVLVIGLDGATLDLVKPWAQAGELPVLAGLMKRGSYARLRSVLPVLSSAAWTSFMTGMNPGKHGIFDFVYRAPDNYQLRPITRLSINGPSLWRLLSDQERRVGVLNVPITYPAETVNGFIVTGLGTPNLKPFASPPELGHRLSKQGYRVNRRLYSHGLGQEDAYLQETCEMTDRVTEAALDLLSEEAWDFFMVVYRGTDEMAHAFWQHMQATHPGHDPTRSSQHRYALRDYYKLIDRHVGRLLEAAGCDTTVLIMSDHGTGPLFKDVYLNEWLRQQGWLVPSKIGSLAPRNLLSRAGFTRNRISRLLRGIGLQRLERLIKDVLGDRIEFLPRNSWPDLDDAVDWSRTRAYSFGYYGQIYVNLQGREPQGIVARGAEYEAMCEEIAQALCTLVDPVDGQPVVDAVYRGSQVYWGPNVELAPDLLVVMRGLSYITRLGYEFGNRTGRIFGTPQTHESASHRLDGLLIAAGPGIQPLATEQDEASILDLAPTILHLLDCRIPAEMDGGILRAWLDGPLATNKRKTFHPEEISDLHEKTGLTETEEAELMERLEHLGYLG